MIEFKNVSKTYDNKNYILKNVNLRINDGEFVFIVGHSGAGKTTLLSLLSGLALPSEGKILYNGKDVADIDKYTFRSKHIGVVFHIYF